MREAIGYLKSIQNFIDPERVERAAAERRLLTLLTPIVKRVQSGELSLPLIITPEQEPIIQGFGQGRVFDGGRLLGYSHGGSKTTTTGPFELRKAVESKKSGRLSFIRRTAPTHELAVKTRHSENSSFSSSQIGSLGFKTFKDEKTTEEIIQFTVASDGSLQLASVFEKYNSPTLGEWKVRDAYTKRYIISEAINLLEAYKGPTES